MRKKAEKERDETQLLADGITEGSAEWEDDAKKYKRECDEANEKLAHLRREVGVFVHIAGPSGEMPRTLVFGREETGALPEAEKVIETWEQAAQQLEQRTDEALKRADKAERERDEAVNISCPGGENCGLVCNAETQCDEALAGQAAMGEALRLAQHDLDTSEGVICVDTGTVPQTTWQLSHPSRVSVDDALANLPALARLADDSPGTPRARLDVVLRHARDKLGHSDSSSEPGELVILRALEEALAGQAVLLKALQGQACMCTSHRVCARCEALTNRSGRVREIMAAVRIAPKLIDMLSQVPVEILWIRQCRHDLLDSEDAKLVLGACKTRLKVLNSAPGVNKGAT